ncbi:hypothetical protein [Tsukamurella sputi]|uniref:hypothetical protein n=1 Tax=Tsukamurella sputi TaxID=2591848 RepID=UPI0013157336|nr:hypothetical protein [Tsukamurella sputi]
MPQLRMHLGVSDSPTDRQKAAVSAWLEHNPVSPVLRQSIIEEGWSDLLHLSA